MPNKALTWKEVRKIVRRVMEENGSVMFQRKAPPIDYTVQFRPTPDEEMFSEYKKGDNPGTGIDLPYEDSMTGKTAWHYGAIVVFGRPELRDRLVKLLNEDSMRILKERAEASAKKERFEMYLKLKKEFEA